MMVWLPAGTLLLVECFPFPPASNSTLDSSMLIFVRAAESDNFMVRTPSSAVSMVIVYIWSSTLLTLERSAHPGPDLTPPLEVDVVLPSPAKMKLLQKIFSWAKLRKQLQRKFLQKVVRVYPLDIGFPCKSSTQKELGRLGLLQCLGLSAIFSWSAILHRKSLNKLPMQSIRSQSSPLRGHIIKWNLLIDIESWFTCLREAVTLWNKAELPSHIRVSCVTPCSRFSVRISTIVMVPLIRPAVGMGRLNGPLLTRSSRDRDACVPLVVWSERRALLAAKLVCLQKIINYQSQWAGHYFYCSPLQVDWSESAWHIPSVKPTMDQRLNFPVTKLQQGRLSHRALLLLSGFLTCVYFLYGLRKCYWGA